MEDALNVIIKLVDYKPTKEEYERLLSQMDYCHQYGYEPIIERGKNIGSKKDTYNIGHYLISKEKTSHTSIMSPPGDFIKRYVTDERDKQMFEFMNKGSEVTLDTFNIISMFYYKVKVLKTISKMATIDDYLLD